MAAYHHIYDSFIHSFIAVCKAHCVDSTKSEARTVLSCRLWDCSLWLPVFCEIGCWLVVLCVPGKERWCWLVVSLYANVTQRCSAQCRTAVCICSRVLCWSLHQCIQCTQVIFYTKSVVTSVIRYISFVQHEIPSVTIVSDCKQHLIVTGLGHSAYGSWFFFSVGNIFSKGRHCVNVLKVKVKAIGV